MLRYICCVTWWASLWIRLISRNQGGSAAEEIERAWKDCSVNWTCFVNSISEFTACWDLFLGKEESFKAGKIINAPKVKSDVKRWANFLMTPWCVARTWSRMKKLISLLSFVWITAHLLVTLNPLAQTIYQYFQVIWDLKQNLFFRLWAWYYLYY